MAVSYVTQIRPLFRTVDINCMRAHGVLLGDASYMCDPTGDSSYPDHANARSVFDRLTGAQTPRMPPDQKWPDPQIALYKTWMEDGYAP